MPTTLLKRVSRAAKAGFTLIELLAVILIISILMTFLLPKIPEAIDGAKVTACKRNLQSIYEGLMLYNTKHGKAPRETGVRFFAQLISHKVWENSEQNAKSLTCPGIDIGALELGAIENSEDWFSDLDAIDGSYSAYAGRDCKNHPLRKFPGSGKEAIICCDNDGGMCHRTTTNVLYASGSVGSFEIADLIADGTLAEDEEILDVGPESPLDVLQKLSLD